MSLIDVAPAWHPNPAFDPLDNVDQAYKSWYYDATQHCRSGAEICAKSQVDRLIAQCNASINDADLYKQNVANLEAAKIVLRRIQASSVGLPPLNRDTYTVTDWEEYNKFKTNPDYAELIRPDAVAREWPNISAASPAIGAAYSPMTAAAASFVPRVTYRQPPVQDYMSSEDDLDMPEIMAAIAAEEVANAADRFPSALPFAYSSDVGYKTPRALDVVVADMASPLPQVRHVFPDAPFHAPLIPKRYATLPPAVPLRTPLPAVPLDLPPPVPARTLSPPAVPARAVPSPAVPARAVPPPVQRRNAPARAVPPVPRTLPPTPPAVEVTRETSHVVERVRRSASGSTVTTDRTVIAATRELPPPPPAVDSIAAVRTVIESERRVTYNETDPTRDRYGRRIVTI